MSFYFQYQFTGFYYLLYIRNIRMGKLNELHPVCVYAASSLKIFSFERKFSNPGVNTDVELHYES